MMRSRNLRANAGQSAVEAMIGLALVGFLVLGVVAMQDYVGKAEQSVRSSLDYVSFATRLHNIATNDAYCSAALGPGALGAHPQNMATGAPVNVTLYGLNDEVLFQAGGKYLSLTIQSLTLQALHPMAPSAAGGVFPARLTAVVGRADSDNTRTFTTLVSVTTAPATLQIVKCNKIKFSNQSYSAPICPPPAPTGSVPGCDSPSPIPYALTVANDGVTLVCQLDYTQCCNHPATFPRLVSGDPRLGTENVQCVPYYCKDGVGHANAFLHSACNAQGFTTNHGP